MKTLNVKRIAAVATGAALLGMTLASAGAVTFQNVPIISNSGQPVVQIVVGSQAKPSDGVAAANIAAAIGNLAYTSVPVTAAVNKTQAAKVLGVQLSGASYTLSNQQVWLNVTGTTSAGAGSYSFTALIGSVLNRAVKTGAPASTKTLQTSSSGYAYTDYGTNTYSTQASPEQSPYTDVGSITTVTTPSASTNGGGITFTTFTYPGSSPLSASNSGDNILHIQSSDGISSLPNSAGAYQESGSLWLTGFPVYNQSSNPVSKQLQIQSVGGAYQAVFAKPIPVRTSSNAVNQAQILLFGQNYTILNYYRGTSAFPGYPTGSVSSSTNAIPGVANQNKIQLAASLSPMQTVYVGHNVTSGPFTVALTDLGQPNSNGVSTASVAVYYNGGATPTNVTQITPGTTQAFNVSGHNLYVNVNSTFAGLYAYQKWAKMQLYSNVFNLTSGAVYNQTSNPSWRAVLEYANASGSGTLPNGLYAIIVYASTPTGNNPNAIKNLNAGQSFNWVTTPAAWSATFVGDTLGKNYDGVTLTSSPFAFESYQNAPSGTVVTTQTVKQYPGNFLFGAGTNTVILNTTAVNESSAELQMASTVTGAFQFGGQQQSSVKYDLTPYALTEVSAANTMAANSLYYANVILSGTNIGNWISTSNPLTIKLYGNQTSSSGVNSSQQGTVTFSASSPLFATVPGNAIFSYITRIELQTRPIPGLTVTVNEVSGVGAGANSITLAKLAPTNGAAPYILYAPTGSHYYQQITSGASVNYQNNAGQATQTITLASAQAANVGAIGHQTQYFTWNAIEYPIPNTQSANDQIAIGIVNSTQGAGANPLFFLNYTASPAGGIDHGTQNNVTYISSASGYPVGPNIVNAQAGFITEKGTKISQITSTGVTINFAKVVDQMQIIVAPTTNGVISKHFALCGPYGLGAAIGPACTGINNVSIQQVNGTVSVKSGTGSYNISGINLVQAVPSVTSATTPVFLTNLTSSPIAVLDSGANPSSNLILIGSGFVNSLSQTLQNSYNITFVPTSAPITQAYGTNRILVAGFYANQTTAAANNFIQQLYAAAGT